MEEGGTGGNQMGIEVGCKTDWIWTNDDYIVFTLIIYFFKKRIRYSMNIRNSEYKYILDIK
jgi:hypothetical protein